MPTWLRSVFGVATGGLNLLANGTKWQQVLLSSAVAGLGIVSHLTSTSNKTEAVVQKQVQQEVNKHMVLNQPHQTNPYQQQR